MYLSFECQTFYCGVFVQSKVQTIIMMFMQNNGFNFDILDVDFFLNGFSNKIKKLLFFEACRESVDRNFNVLEFFEIENHLTQFINFL